MFGEMFNNLTKIVVVFLVMVCFLMLGAFYLRYSIAAKLNSLGQKLAVSSEHEAITDMLFDLNKADNNYQEAIINGDTLKFIAYRASLDEIFDKLNKVADSYALDTTTKPFVYDDLLKNALAGKIDLSRKVFQIKKDFDSLLLNTERSFNQSMTKSQTVTQQSPDFKTVTVTDTVLTKTVEDRDKKRGLFKRLKDALLNKSDKDSIGSTVVIKQKEQLLQTATQTKGDPPIPVFLDRLKIEHINLSVYQQKLVLSNLKLLTELRDIITNMSTYYNKLWQLRQKEYLKQHAATTLVLDRFNMFIMGLVVVFLFLLFFYIGKVGKAEMRYKLENNRAVQLAEERSEMLARMSHEIRNPLMAITGFIDLMQEDELNFKHQRMVDSIHIASEMLINTVNDILDITKFQHDETKMIEVRPFIPFRELIGVVDAMQFVATKKNIGLHFEFKGDKDKSVGGDSFRLKQVLLNLLNNAIKFTDEGEIRIYAQLMAENEDKYLLKVEVQDSGAGIKKEFQPNLFSKYFQAHSSREKGGSGLGLYICKQLLQLQGGDIQLYSEGEGKGCVFTFTVPYKHA